MAIITSLAVIHIILHFVVLIIHLRLSVLVTVYATEAQPASRIQMAFGAVIPCLAMLA